jgi:xanthine dehydrogenase YagR molybdenum-binding subunit
VGTGNPARRCRRRAGHRRGDLRRDVHPATGCIANATFGDYLLPAYADVPDIDVVFVAKPDEVRPIGIKGAGEIGIIGVSAAIANAVYHATGRRIRSLPITTEQLL